MRLLGRPAYASRLEANLLEPKWLRTYVYMYMYACKRACSVPFFVFSPAVLLQTMIVIIIDMFVGIKAVGESELTMFVKKHSLSFTWSFSLNCSCSRSISASVRIGGTGRKALECYNTIIL